MSHGSLGSATYHGESPVGVCRHAPYWGALRLVMDAHPETAGMHRLGRAASTQLESVADRAVQPGMQFTWLSSLSWRDHRAGCPEARHV